MTTGPTHSQPGRQHTQRQKVLIHLGRWPVCETATQQPKTEMNNTKYLSAEFSQGPFTPESVKQGSQSLDLIQLDGLILRYGVWGGGVY